MGSKAEANREHQRRFKARQRERGLRPLVLQVPPEHVAAHEAAVAGRPQEIERMRARVEATVREHVLKRLDRWTHKAVMQQARKEARQHPASSNAPPARLRFGKRLPRAITRQLRGAGWWYDWIASVWNRPEDPDRWHEMDSLIAEVTAAADAAGVSVLPLASGPGLAHLGASLVPPPSLWQRERLNVTGRTAWRFAMHEKRERLVHDLQKVTPAQGRHWRLEDGLRSLHIWVRPEDAETHQLAAWKPHALARLRDRLTVELMPEARRRVLRRMALQVENARQMQARDRAGPQDAAPRDRDDCRPSEPWDPRTARIPDWMLGR